MNERERAQPSLKAKPQRAWWRRHGLEIAVIAALFFGIQAYNTRGAASGPAPQLADYRLNGERTTLAPSDEPVMVRTFGLRGAYLRLHGWQCRSYG